MKVLVVGSGGREHALCWRLGQCPGVTRLYCAPGNPGTAAVAQNVPIAVNDIDALLAFAKEQQIRLTVVGPELPLSVGIVDRFEAAGLAIVGPEQAAARLESSKSFAKEIMLAAGAPTATSVSCTDEASLRASVLKTGAPVVLKADGLAAGKGVFVCMTMAEAEAAIGTLFGEMNAEVVVAEEFLAGVEASLIVVTDGETIVPLAPAHDYKRISDNDAGPNTGGMGNVSPTPRLSEEQATEAIETIVRPVIREMNRRGTPFRGFLYAGLMLCPDGRIMCLEFNARLGDPECQVIMPRLTGDLASFFLAVSERRLKDAVQDISWTAKSCVCVVLAAEGYPEKVRTGDEIDGLQHVSSLPDVFVFHAGTTTDSRGKICTAGGRVLGVTALGDSLESARHNAYRACDMIQFRGRQMRRDIGAL